MHGTLLYTRVINTFVPSRPIRMLTLAYYLRMLRLTQFGARLQPCTNKPWEEEVSTEHHSVSTDLLWHAVPTAARSSTCQLGRGDSPERRRGAEHRRQHSNVGSNLNVCSHHRPLLHYRPLLHHPLLEHSLHTSSLECPGCPLTTAMGSSTRPFPQTLQCLSTCWAIAAAQDPHSACRIP